MRRPGVVFNGQYLFLYDVALTELFREAIGPYDEMVRDGADIVVAEARLRFLAGARFDDELDIELPDRQARHHEHDRGTPTFRVDGREMVEGEVRHVFVDAGQRLKLEIPADDPRAPSSRTCSPAPARRRRRGGGSRGCVRRSARSRRRSAATPRGRSWPMPVDHQQLGARDGPRGGLAARGPHQQVLGAVDHERRAP